MRLKIDGLGLKDEEGFWVCEKGLPIGQLINKKLMKTLAAF